MGTTKKPRREWRTNNGVQEVKCTSCSAFKPADRKHYYLQRYKGQFVPHSWCKPCYLTNSGRGRGMRIHAVEVAPLPEVVADAQRGFVALPAVGPMLSLVPVVFARHDFAEAS